MQSILNPARTGRAVVNGALVFLGYMGLFADAAREATALRHPAVRNVLYRQVYFTGVEALWVTTAWGALMGMAVTAQVVALVGLDAHTTGKILGWAVVREIGPLFAAILLISRSATATASEIGSMKVNKELVYIKTMGIPPIGYLVVPRIAGITLCSLFITFYFEATTIGGGLLASSVLYGASLVPNMQGIVATFEVGEVVTSLAKGVLYGIILSTVSCFHGLRVERSITEIPQKTTSAVMQSLFIILMADVTIALVSRL